MKKFAIALSFMLLGAAILGFAVFKLPFWLSDEPHYRACVANDFARGVPACTRLLARLANNRSLDLKDIDDASGAYWVAEILSYRGRHYLR